MTLFVLLAALLAAIGLAFILPPLLRGSSHRADVDRARANLGILKDQLAENVAAQVVALAELEADHARGTVADAQYTETKAELERRVIEETQVAETPAVSAGRAATRGAAVAIALALPVAAALFYWRLGDPGALDPALQAAGRDDPHAAGGQQVEQMVKALRTRLEKEPDNADGWSTLARSYYAMRKFPEATAAYEKLVALVPDDAGLLADYADAAAMANGRRFDGKPRELVARALKLDPTQWKALAMAGTDAFEQRDYRLAVSYWEQLRAQLPPDSPIAQSIVGSIAEARQKGGIGEDKVAAAAAPKPGAARGEMPNDDAHKAVPRKAAPAAQAEAKAAPKADAKAAVSGLVDLAPALKAKAQPTDTVFIFARAANGPRMPIALTTVQVKDLPAKFTLDDSLAPTPNFKLSSQPEVVVAARVSRSGQMMPASGDLEGASSAVKLGARDVKVTINSVLP